MGWLESVRSYLNDKIRKLLPRERGRGATESVDELNFEIYLHPADLVQSLHYDFETESDEDIPSEPVNS